MTRCAKGAARTAAPRHSENVTYFVTYFVIYFTLGIKGTVGRASSFKTPLRRSP
jgi:hypothetical protein